jgi:uncharacterized integral membrane protein
MLHWGRWVGLALVVVLAGVFAYLNGGERVTLYLGVTILYRISLVGLVFFAFLLGMLVMFLVGLGHDLRVRRLLREYRFQDPPPTALRAPDPPPESHP